MVGFPNPVTFINDESFTFEFPVTSGKHIVHMNVWLSNLFTVML